MYFIRSGEDQGKRSFPPFKLIELDGVTCGPVPSKYIEVDPNHLERDMIAVMEAQRREFPQVGGFCQLTSLTQHAVTQRILRRWPGDEIAAAAAAVTADVSVASSGP